MIDVPMPVADVVERAAEDANVVGVLLKGSRSTGTADGDSDWDLVVVLRDGEPTHQHSGSLDVLRTTLERLRTAPAFERPAIGHAQVLLDKTGEVRAAVDAAARIGRDELAELYDSYLNDFYRSIKAWRRGNELAARMKAARSLWWLGEFLLGLGGRRAPYPSAWEGRLGELEPLLLAVARHADASSQQRLQARVEAIATAHGFRDVYDGWTNGEIDRAMAYRADAADPTIGAVGR